MMIIMIGKILAGSVLCHRKGSDERMIVLPLCAMFMFVGNLVAATHGFHRLFVRSDCEDISG